MPVQSTQSTAVLLDRWDSLCAAQPSAPVLWGVEQSWSRRDLQEAALRLAADLSSQLRAGQICGLQAPNGPTLLMGLLALWRCGVVVLFIDADQPPARSRDLVRRLGGAHLLRAGGPADAPDLQDLSGPTHPPAAMPEGIAAIKLSSGSTGAPRGILMSAAALQADADALEAAMEIGAGDRVLVAVPMTFSYGLGSLVLPALLHGRELVLPEPGMPTDILAAARRHAATVLPTVPFYLSSLLRRNGRIDLPPSLRLIVSAGAPLPPATAQAFVQASGQPVRVLYGASEVGGICYDASGAAARAGLVGQPLPGVELRLEEPEGLVWVRSPGLFSGYWPAEPGAPQPAWYESADLGRMEAGGLRLLGRRSHLVNLGGYKLDPRQVAAVIEDLEGVRSAHVTALQLPGRELPSCCALVEADEAALCRERVLAHCREHLPAMERPRRLVLIEQIPRNPRGKVDAATVDALLRNHG